MWLTCFFFSCFSWAGWTKSQGKQKKKKNVKIFEKGDESKIDRTNQFKMENDKKQEKTALKKQNRNKTKKDKWTNKKKRNLSLNLEEI